MIPLSSLTPTVAMSIIPNLKLMIVAGPVMVLAYYVGRALWAGVMGPKRRITAKIRGCAASSSPITLLAQGNAFDLTLDYSYVVDGVTYRGRRLLSRAEKKNGRSARDLVKFFMMKGQIPVCYRKNKPSSSWIEAADMQEMVNEYCDILNIYYGSNPTDNWMPTPEQPTMQSAA